MTAQRTLTPELRRQAYLRETGRIKMAEAMEPPLLPRHLPPRPKRETRSSIQLAESDGYRAGFYNRQGTDTTYQTGAEYIAWYAGWKQGQKERNR